MRDQKFQDETGLTNNALVVRSGGHGVLFQTHYFHAPELTFENDASFLIHIHGYKIYWN